MKMSGTFSFSNKYKKSTNSCLLFHVIILFRRYGWAADIVAVGELITLTVVVLVGFVAQPRLQFAMAEDGLLPSIFARVTKSGNLFWGTLIGGLFAIIIAGWVPFSYITDLISAGCLLSFQLTNTACALVHADPTMTVEITTESYDAVVAALEEEEGGIEDLTLDSLKAVAAQNPGSGVFDRKADGGGSFKSVSVSGAAVLGMGGSGGGYGATGGEESDGTLYEPRASDADDEGGDDVSAHADSFSNDAVDSAEVVMIHVPKRSYCASTAVRTLTLLFHFCALTAALCSKPLVSGSVKLNTGDDFYFSI